MTYTPEQAAKFLNYTQQNKLGKFKTYSMSVKRLWDLRSRGKGPEFTRTPEGDIFYSREALEKYKLIRR